MSLTTETNAFPKFKPFIAITNQLPRSSMLRTRCPISDGLFFVVSDDIKILLLLLKAAEETQGAEIEAALGPTVPRCPKQHFYFFLVLLSTLERLRVE